MIVKKHRKPARKADKRRAATLLTTGKKALGPVTKVANAAKAAAENRNHANRWGAEVLRPGAIRSRSRPRYKYEIPYIRLSAYTPAQPNLALIGADR